MRELAGSTCSSKGSAPIERDPVGAGMRIIIDPSASNIEKMLGLDDWD
jgi:hypothetical protein